MSMEWIVILAIGGGLAVVSLFIGLAIILGRRSIVEERLGQYTDRTYIPTRPVERKERKLSHFSEGLDKALKRRSFASGISTELARADLKLTVAEYLMLIFISVVIGFGIGFLISRTPVLALVGGVFGFFLPRWYVGWRQRRRVRAFNEGLGDTINLLTNSLRSGYSMLQAIETVSKEMSPPISTEFARVVKEVGLGLTIEEALANLLRRINSDDLDLLVTAINIQHEVGGNLADILESIAHTIRERVRIKGEIRVLTTQGRISGYIISFLPIALGFILFFINREYILSLFQHVCGWVMIVTASFAIATGFLAIRRIVNIEV
jgi:tight adherence protein B